MNASEKKYECRLECGGETVDAVLHLIEVPYDGRFVFWNGVAELTTEDAARLLGDMQGDLASIGVRLSDGRTGCLYMVQGNGQADLTGAGAHYFGLAVVGWPHGELGGL
jgi:hypothetical protein